jgi:hypothetical protein
MNIAAEKRYAVVTWAVVFVAVLALGAICLSALAIAFISRSRSSIFQGFLGFVSIFGLARYYVTLKGCGFSRKKVLALSDLCLDRRDRVHGLPSLRSPASFVGP